MFERFSADARRAVVIAQDEAGRLNHNYIGTEHLLLGLLRQPEGIAAVVLNEFGITLDGAREQVERIVGLGKNPAGKGHIPFTPRAKKVLELSLREALRLGHNYIGTEHILLGLIREEDGVAGQIMAGHAILKDIRVAVVNRAPLGSGDPGETESAGTQKRTVRARRWERFGFGHAGERATSADIAVADEPEMRTTPAGNATLAEAVRLAGPEAMGSHHLLLAALVDANSAAASALTSLGVDLDQVREALRTAKVTGTSDESPEEAGRRQMALEVNDGVLRLVLTDPVIVAAGEAALLALSQTPKAAGDQPGSESATATVIRGDHPAAASFADVWAELRESLERIRTAAAATPPAA
jgi:ATP-dependent Clp protease ATP-binding subunit ClpC